MTDSKQHRKRKPGRPSKYTKALGDAICRRLVEGKSLREICRDGTMPSDRSVYRWLEENQEFRQQYARAREMQAERMADEILEIADDATNDWMERQRGEGEAPVTVPNTEHIQRSRLRVDARKWLMSKLLPKKYGDRQAIEHTGEDGRDLRAPGTVVVLPAKEHIEDGKPD